MSGLGLLLFGGSMLALGALLVLWAVWIGETDDDDRAS